MKAADRRHFLGGSDAASVLGVSAYKSPVELWQEKVGKSKTVVTEAQRRLWARGHELEPFIRKMTIQKLADEGNDVELIATNERHVDAEHPFLSSEIDFDIRLNGEHVPVDAKSVNRHVRDRWGTTGTDEMPIDYVAQFMHNMGVHPKRPRRYLVAALRSFDDVDLYWLQRDDETIAAMREKEVRFWVDHVIPRIPPDPGDFADVSALFPKAKKPNIEATPEILAAVARLRQIKIDAAALKAEEDEVKFQLAKFMGPHAVVTQGVRNLISWDNTPTRRFDLEAFRRDHADWVALYMKETTGRTMRFAPKRG
jgi:predicted phage-related endonuclease